MRRYLPMLLFSLCLVGTILSVRSGAQTGQNDSGVSAADAKEIYNYTIDMDKLNKMSAVVKALGPVARNHRDLQNLGESQDLNGMVQTIQRYPEAMAAVTGSGFTPREYVLCLVNFMQIYSAVGMKKSGTYSDYPPEMLKAVSRANLEFGEQHWKEIQQITQGGSSND